jgi:cell division protein FtsI (penicillin-binding protein 3)
MRKPVPPPAELPRTRALVLFGALALLFVVLVGRSLYLQWVENDFLQGQGAARFSREIEVPAHRGRIVDRNDAALAISTPVKSLWVFRDQVSASPAELAALARVLDTTPREIASRIAGDGDFAFVAKQLSPETAERAMKLGIKGLNEQNEYRRYYPGGDVTAQIVGFTGDKDLGQEGIELAQQQWLGGTPGSRRVIINRRGEIVEDVAAILAEVIHEIGAHHRPSSGPVRCHLRSPVQPAPGADEPREPAPAVRSAPARAQPRVA